LNSKAREIFTSGCASGPERSGAVSGHLRPVAVPSDASERGGASYTCSTVARPFDEIVAGLEQAIGHWTKSRDRSILRQHLLALLLLVEATA
jgi:hypothetical protein